MNFDKFYTETRARFGPLKSQAQVDGFNLILAYALQRGTLLPFLAYILATVWHETNATMQPVREAYWLSEDWRRRNLRYYPYYGRGFVQLTWLVNYVLAAGKLGVPFDKQPDLVMQPEHALHILFLGMEEGWFTAKKLTDYIDEDDEIDAADLAEYKAGRKIVNGTDKAALIAGYALDFEYALKAGAYPWKPIPVSTVGEDVPTVPPVSTTTEPVVVQPVSFWRWLLSILFPKAQTA